MVFYLDISALSMCSGDEFNLVRGAIGTGYFVNSSFYLQYDGSDYSVYFSYRDNGTQTTASYHVLSSGFNKFELYIRINHSKPAIAVNRPGSL